MSFNIDEEWEDFMNGNQMEEIDDDDNSNENIINNANIISANIVNELCPKASDIYISTKTNISYLNTTIDLKNIFWDIPVISYGNPICGVVKKQMKFNSLTIEELDFIQEKLKNELCVEENIITNINNPNGRIKFKDIRKVSIGISQKDLTSYRCKKKSAFYNCFVVIIRIKYKQKFKEFHVKVFNTGKLEIPGIQSDESFNDILNMIIAILQPHISKKLEYKPDSTETVLINSNFNCGFYINRETLFDILKTKYNLQCIYDPCSYPGIQCKFYYNPKDEIQTGVQLSSQQIKTMDSIINVSFMIFRTGSVLIVGKCQESVLITIYEFLKNILIDEFKYIGVKLIETDEINNKPKKKKNRVKHIMVSV